MRGPHPSLRFDSISLIEVEVQKTMAMLQELRSEERRLLRQLEKAKEQVAYYESFLNEAAKKLRGGRRGFTGLLQRLK